MTQAEIDRPVPVVVGREELHRRSTEPDRTSWTRDIGSSVPRFSFIYAGLPEFATQFGREPGADET
jgi:hypothetical protein